GHDIVEHMEGVGDEGEGVHDIADDELDEEEGDIDDQKNDDPLALGEGHDWDAVYLKMLRVSRCIWRRRLVTAGTCRCRGDVGQE
ncbi:hypothetical protein LTR33_015358, partial [Friedmanniomyces endolithicus]